MSAAWLDVGAELIRIALHLPEACEVVCGDGDTECGVVRLLIDSPDIPLGAKQVNAIFQRVDGVTSFVRFDALP